LMTTFLVSFTFAIIVHRKNLLLIPLMALLILCGWTVFTDTEYKPAENMEKISEEAILVSDIIMRDFEGLPEDAVIEPNRAGIENIPYAVVPEPICEDIRMYNANIGLWYVRQNFGSARLRRFQKIASLMSLSNAEVPVKTLTRGMAKQGYEYFVLGDWQELTGDVGAYNIQMIGETEHYRVYKYSKTKIYKMTQYADTEGFQCMSYTIESNKGGLIVVDGGRAWQTESLVETIRKKGGVVDAWIITHPHDDHCGALASVLEAEWDKSHIEIKQILIGEMDYEAVMEEGSERAGAYTYLKMGLERFGNVTWLSAGDELSIIGLRMKVLHTCNDTVLENSDNIMNDGSMVFKLYSEKKSVLFLADTADNTAEMAAEITDYSQGSKIGRLIADEIMKNYPDDVKSTIVQMSHHGNGSYPDYFYEAINPRIAFFDAPQWLMENKNKDTGEPSYYSTPHYVELMERMGARIVSYDTKRDYAKFR
nr:MBL fold metallo-hydrolase [Lachnospiraceae bacterium]